MARILIVCTGNLCRSPMAMGLLRARIARDRERRDWHVGSAGVWATEGQPASGHALEEMARRGIDLRHHRTRPVSGGLVEAADLVLVMTRYHAEAVRSAFPEHAHKVHLFSELAGETYDVRDPFGGTLTEYACIAEELAQLIEEGYERLVSLAEEGTGH